MKKTKARARAQSQSPTLCAQCALALLLASPSVVHTLLVAAGSGGPNAISPETKRGIRGWRWIGDGTEPTRPCLTFKRGVVCGM
jgi:hypothetical protein